MAARYLVCSELESFTVSCMHGDGKSEILSVAGMNDAQLCSGVRRHVEITLTVDMQICSLYVFAERFLCTSAVTCTACK